MSEIRWKRLWPLFPPREGQPVEAIRCDCSACNWAILTPILTEVMDDAELAGIVSAQAETFQQSLPTCPHMPAWMEQWQAQGRPSPFAETPS